MRMVFVILFSTLFWLLLLEGGAYLLTGWVGDGLDVAKVVLRPDSNLGWRQKENFDGKFMEKELKTNSFGFREKKENFSEGVFKIALLGPSSAFGWGVELKDTYAKVLERELGKSRKVEVFNLGQIGFSSWQGTQLIREEWFKINTADLILIAYGVNDIDRHRFYFSVNKT